VGDPDGLLRHTDLAMYRAKERGRNRSEIFDPMADSRVKAKRGVIEQIIKAIENQELHLLCQPKVDCRSGKAIGLESLLKGYTPTILKKLEQEVLETAILDDVQMLSNLVNRLQCHGLSFSKKFFLRKIPICEACHIFAETSMIDKLSVQS
jgi:hypothetical protein